MMLHDIDVILNSKVVCKLPTAEEKYNKIQIVNQRKECHLIIFRFHCNLGGINV